MAEGKGSPVFSPHVVGNPIRRTISKLLLTIGPIFAINKGVPSSMHLLG